MKLVTSMRWLIVIAIQLSCLYCSVSAAPAFRNMFGRTGSEVFRPEEVDVSAPPVTQRGRQGQASYEPSAPPLPSSGTSGTAQVSVRRPNSDSRPSVYPPLAPNHAPMQAFPTLHDQTAYYTLVTNAGYRAEHLRIYKNWPMVKPSETGNDIVPAYFAQHTNNPSWNHHPSGLRPSDVAASNPAPIARPAQPSYKPFSKTELGTAQMPIQSSNMYPSISNIPPIQAAPTTYYQPDHHNLFPNAGYRHDMNVAGPPYSLFSAEEGITGNGGWTQATNSPPWVMNPGYNNLGEHPYPQEPSNQPSNFAAKAGLVPMNPSDPRYGVEPYQPRSQAYTLLRIKNGQHPNGPL